VATDAFESPSGVGGGVVERFEVGVDSGEVAEQRLYPGLVGGCEAPPEVLGGIRAHGHELSGVTGKHLTAVVADRQQQGNLVVVGQIRVGIIETGSGLVAVQSFASGVLWRTGLGTPTPMQTPLLKNLG